MPKDVANQFSHLVLGAATRGEHFLNVVQQRCNAANIGVHLEAFRRPNRDGGGMALKGDLKYGQGIEVFAEPLGPSLQVGYQFTTHEAGGILSGVGMFGDINARRAKKQLNPRNQREVDGKIQAFQQFVFAPVIQELTDAIGQQEGGAPQRNGFLGS